MMTRLLLVMITCVLFLPTIILILPHNLNKEILVTVLIIGILIIPTTIFLSIKGMYSKETVILQTTSFISEKYGEINLYDIKKMKFETYKGLRIRLYLKNGLVLGISPFNQFKSKASREFIEFYKELELKNKTIANSQQTSPTLKSHSTTTLI